jgi:hypothetical protein
LLKFCGKLSVTVFQISPNLRNETSYTEQTIEGSTIVLNISGFDT